MRTWYTSLVFFHQRTRFPREPLCQLLNFILHVLPSNPFTFYILSIELESREGHEVEETQVRKLYCVFCKIYDLMPLGDFSILAFEKCSKTASKRARMVEEL